MTTQEVIPTADHFFCDSNYEKHCYRFLYSFVYDGSEDTALIVNKNSLSKCVKCLAKYREYRSRMLAAMKALYEDVSEFDVELLVFEMTRVRHGLESLNHNVYQGSQTALAILELVLDRQRFLVASRDAPEDRREALSADVALIRETVRKHINPLGVVLSQAMREHSDLVLGCCLRALPDDDVTSSVVFVALDSLCRDRPETFDKNVSVDVGKVVTPWVSELKRLTTDFKRTAEWESRFVAVLRSFSGVCAVPCLVPSSAQTTSMVWMEAMDSFKCAALGIMKINDQVDDQVVDLVSHAAVVVEATPLGEFLTKELPSLDNSSLSSCGSSPVAAPVDDRPSTSLDAQPAKAETKKPPPTLAEVLDSDKLRPVTKRPKAPSKLSDRLRMGGRGPGGVSSRLLSKVGRPDPLPRPPTVTPRRRDPPRQVEVPAAPTRRREARAIQLNDTRKDLSRGETDSGSNVSAVSSTAKASRMTPAEIQAAMAKAASEVQRMLGQLLSWNIMRVADQRVPELEIRHDKLPAYFKSMDVFQKAFRPLVLDECRCGIVNDTIATQLEPFPVKILSSTKMTEWLSVNILSNKKSQDFLQSTLQSGVTVVDVNQANRNELERLPFRPMDLLLLIPGPGTDINGRRFAQVKQPPSDGYLLAYVDKSDDTDRKLKTWRQNQVATLKMLSAPPDATHKGRISPTRLAVSSQWSAYQISSLVTSVREFEAMYMARFSVLFPYILNPKTSSMEITSTFGENRSKFKHMAKLSNLNGSQVGIFDCRTFMLFAGECS